MMPRLLSFLFLVLLISCAKDVVIDQIEYVEYSDKEYDELSEVLDLPRNFDIYKTGNSFGHAVFGSLTKATLGRVLFYDKSLSEDGTVSCGSCHKQEFAFADNAALSEGIYGRITDRNSLALGTFSSFEGEYGSDGNPGSSNLFWDMRASSTQQQIESTMANEKEMGMRMDEVVDRIKGKRHYEILFDKAFGTTEVKGHMVLSALETFMQSMSTSNSKFDQMQNGINLGGSQVFLTDPENRGHKLFAANCASCHGRSVNMLTLSGTSLTANNGLDRESHDRGLGQTTGLEEDNGRFKIPSLRNIALTAPYMHDGRFTSLREVIDFYSDGIQQHKNLGVELQNEDGLPKKFNFSEEDKYALVAFLNTFTDMAELKHSKFSDPWLK